MIAMRYSGTVFLSLVMMGACAENGDVDEIDAGADVSDTATAVGMQEMPGMGGMQSQSMMEDMASHMEAMRGATGDSIKAMLPMHRQMTANMLSQMDSEMRSMNMSDDTSWTAAADSVRNDMARMAEMDAEELRTFMPAHQERMRRLMDMHRTMMRGHGM